MTSGNPADRPRFNVLHSPAGYFYIWDSVEYREFTELTNSRPENGGSPFWQTPDKSEADQYAAELNAMSEPTEPAPAARSMDDPERLDAEGYRYLRDVISATMTGPDVWDTDDSESYILAEYVKWLAAGRPVDAEGYPDRTPGAEARRPDPYRALTLAVEAFELAEGRLSNPDEFRLSTQGTLERVRDALAQIRDALIGDPAGADPEGTQSAPEPPIPSPGEVYRHRQDGYRIIVRRVDTAAGIARTSGTERTELVGRVNFRALAEDFERVGNVGNGTESAPEPTRAADLIDREKSHVLPADRVEELAAYTDALAEAFPRVPEVCKYSAAHLSAGVPAVTVLDCGPAGRIPACQQCADLYQRMN